MPHLEEPTSACRDAGVIPWTSIHRSVATEKLAGWALQQQAPIGAVLMFEALRVSLLRRVADR